jgi:tRNA uridine 5-carboxymethylaminomethyl modification enzyme
VLGKAIEHEYNLFDLLRRPDVTYPDDVRRAAHYEHLKLPLDLDYMQVTSLSFEARQRLAKHRPETLGLASRMTGITPATISLLMIHLKKGGFKEFAAAPVQEA